MKGEKVAPRSPLAATRVSCSAVASRKTACSSLTNEPAVESGVTYLPPRQGERPTYALLFQRSQLQARLLRPLAAKLPEARPPQADAIPPQEAATIDGLTAPDLYRFSFTRGQDGGIWLVFNPPSLG